MTPDELKLITVRVEGGSGVLVTPLSSEYHYILTAFHVIENKQGDQLSVAFNQNSEVLKGKAVSIREVIKNEAMDAAVIVIDRIDANVPFVGFEDYNAANREWEHLGYPLCRKDAVGNIECAILSVVKIKGRTTCGFVEYEYDKQVANHELKGTSGGGIFDESGRLIGVHKQSVAKDEQEQLGAALLIPSEVYVELIEANGFPSVQKYDLSSFETFFDGIFDFSSNKALSLKLKGTLSDLAIVKPELLAVSVEKLYQGFREQSNATQWIDPQHVEYGDWAAFGEFLIAMRLLLNISLGNDCAADIAKEYQYTLMGEDIDIYEIREKIDLKLLGILSPEKKIVVGGISDKGYDYDVIPGNGSIPNIARAASSEGLDIAKSGRALLDKFTFINAHLFHATLEHFAKELEKIDKERLEYYCNKIKEACNGVEDVQK